MSSIWLLLLTTESGDGYEWLLSRKPTNEEVYKLFMDEIPEELGDDPDDKWGTAQYWRLVETAVYQLD